MTSKSSPEFDHWYLVGQGPRGSGPREGPSITVERALSPDEAAAIRASNSLVKRLAGIAPYSQLVEAYENLEQAALQTASPERRAADMNQAAAALGRAAAELPGRLEESAEADFRDDADQLELLRTAIAEEKTRPPFQLLTMLADIQPLFDVGEGHVRPTDAAAAVLSEALSKITPDGDVLLGCFAGLVVAQRLIARELLFYRDVIDEATRRVRLLAANVPTGVPALMRDEKLDLSTGRIALSAPRFDPLALIEGQFLHEALRHSEQLLRETDPALQAKPPADTSGESRATLDHPEQEPDIAGEPGDADVQEAPTAPSQTPTSAAQRDDLVVDFDLLVREATTLTDEVERAWSDALDTLDLTDARAGLGARLRSLLVSIARRSEATTNALQDGGFDPSIPRYPLGPDEELDLTVEADAERGFRQAQMAELETLELLTHAIQGLAAPSAVEITISELGEARESWWEAGAFDLVRRRADYLRRVSEAAGRAEAAIHGRQIDDDGWRVFDRLRLASEAMSRGDPEAALLHCGLALAASIQQHAPSALEPLAYLAARIEDARAAALLTQLDVALATLARHGELDVGAAALLAPRVLALTGHLCFERPDDLRRSLNDEVSADE